MATESDLRDLLRGPDPEGRGEIDLDAVLSRTRRRRRPRVIVAQALGSVAMIGVLGTAIVVGIPRADQGVMMTAEDAAGGSAEELAPEVLAPEADDSTFLGPASAATLNACATPVSQLEFPSDLTLEMEPVTAAVGSASIPVTVTMRNDGHTRMVGVTGEPYLTLSLDNTVVWHSNGPRGQAGVPVDLDPGETMVYSANLEPVVCGAEDTAEGFRDDLPSARPGDYELRAALDFVSDDATILQLVTGPPASVELR